MIHPRCHRSLDHCRVWDRVLDSWQGGTALESSEKQWSSSCLAGSHGFGERRDTGTEKTEFAAWIIAYTIIAYTITRRSCAGRSLLIERCACSTNWNPSSTFQFETFFFPSSQALTTLKLKIIGVVFMAGSLAALRLFRVTDSDSRCVFM